MYIWTGVNTKFDNGNDDSVSAVFIRGSHSDSQPFTYKVRDPYSMLWQVCLSAIVMSDISHLISNVAPESG